MSCNGCRVLRKGCSDSCILRPCLQWIEGPEAQGHATVFVAKFFGRAGLMNFISAVPDNQRPALFQSLLYEACGRTVNPVFGAVGLLWSGSWHICQAAVETVLKGGSLHPGVSTAAAATTLFHRHNRQQTSPGTRSPTSVLERPVAVETGVKREFEIVAPVPRRIRPKQQLPDVDDHRLQGQQQQQQQQQRETIEKAQALDLDLTLGSSTSPKLALPLDHEEHSRALLASKRVHSPCRSITSEGSVTSVDTADLKISLQRHEEPATRSPPLPPSST